MLDKNVVIVDTDPIRSLFLVQAFRSAGFESAILIPDQTDQAAEDAAGWSAQNPIDVCLLVDMDASIAELVQRAVEEKRRGVNFYRATLGTDGVKHANGVRPIFVPDYNGGFPDAVVAAITGYECQAVQ
jgi:hypothetical protein